MDLQIGMQGLGVRNLQSNLKQLGISPLVIDGDFGPQTLSALKAFQAAHGLAAEGVAGDTTQKAIAKALVGQIPAPDGPAVWLSWMHSHIGEVEQTGAAATAFDKEVFSHTSYGNLNGIMEPGCAATACAALEETGFKSPHNAGAESFRNFGLPCELKPGAIVGFNWEGKPEASADHVTFCDHVINDKLVACLGGNQSHKVQISVFSKSAIAFVRWPFEPLQNVKVESAIKAEI